MWNAIQQKSAMNQFVEVSWNLDCAHGNAKLISLKSSILAFVNCLIF